MKSELLFHALKTIAPKINLVILDRDGVVNHDSPDYIKSPDEWCPIDGSLEAIAKLNQHGFHVCVATNQSGIGRGYFNEQTLFAMHEKMEMALAKLDAHLDGIFFCPHTPDDDCDCRKPKPGLYERAMQLLDTPPENTLVIGDALRDLEAAATCGANAVLVSTGQGGTTLRENKLTVDYFDNLAQVVDALAVYHHE